VGSIEVRTVHPPACRSRGRRSNPPLARQEARESVARYATWPIVQIDPAMILLASRLEEQQQLSSWDVLSLEAAVRAGRPAS